MLELREIEQVILANGRVDGPELRMLRRELYADGKIDRQEADFLVELHKRVQHMTPAHPGGWPDQRRGGRLAAADALRSR